MLRCGLIEKSLCRNTLLQRIKQGHFHTEQRIQGNCFLQRIFYNIYLHGTGCLWLSMSAPALFNDGRNEEWSPADQWFASGPLTESVLKTHINHTTLYFSVCIIISSPLSFEKLPLSARSCDVVANTYFRSFHYYHTIPKLNKTISLLLLALLFLSPIPLLSYNGCRYLDRFRYWKLRCTKIQ